MPNPAAEAFAATITAEIKAITDRQATDAARLAVAEAKIHTLELEAAVQRGERNANKRSLDWLVPMIIGLTVSAVGTMAAKFFGVL